jgi:DNA-binding transcriptional ArsR family regulator
MEIRRDVFQAIADPNRRAIIRLIANQKLTLNGVADHFDISRPAISKHIKILTECGLITLNQQGRERYCEARLEKLSEVADWVSEYKKFWETKLDALEIYLDQLQSKKRPKSLKPKPITKKGKRKS